MNAWLIGVAVGALMGAAGAAGARSLVMRHDCAVCRQVLGPYGEVAG